MGVSVIIEAFLETHTLSVPLLGAPPLLEGSRGLQSQSTVCSQHTIARFETGHSTVFCKFPANLFVGSYELVDKLKLEVVIFLVKFKLKY